MTKSENTPLNKNELEIVRLTVEGESQRSIAKQLGLSPSAVCRTLQRAPCNRENSSLQHKSFTTLFIKK